LAPLALAATVGENLFAQKPGEKRTRFMNAALEAKGDAAIVQIAYYVYAILFLIF